MVTSILVSLIFIISISFPKFIHKYHYPIYIISGIIALVLSGQEANIVTLGYVPLSFMIIVMYTGVFQRGFIKKRLMTVRAENAIIGIIFLLPHAIGFLEFYLESSNLFDSFVPLLGLCAFILSIPLFITSFKFIRKKFNYLQWKSIHRLAYAFYLLLFAHLAFINNDRLVFYILLFGMYFILKYFDIHKANKKPSKI